MKPFKNALHFRALLVLLSVFACLGAMAQDTAEIKRLEMELKHASDFEKVEMLNRLSELYQAVDLEKSIAYDLQNLEIQKQYNKLRDQSSVLNNLGISTYYLGDYAASLNYLEQSLALREQFGDTLNIVKTLNNLGAISQVIGDFDQAIKYLQRSVFFKMKLDDTLSLAKTLNNIGVIYKDVNKYELAKRFLNQALEKYLLIGDSSGIAAAYNNLGLVYDVRHKSDSALFFYHRSLKIKRILHDDRGIANSLNNIGLIYLDKLQLTKAINYFTEAIEIRRQINDKAGLASAMNNLARAYLCANNNARAGIYLHKSMDIAGPEKLLTILKRNYLLYSELYEGLGKYDSSLIFYKKYTAVNDSIYSENFSDQLASLNIRFETEKSKKENEILRQKNHIQALEIENNKKKQIQFVTIIFLMFFASIIVVLFLQFRNNRRMSRQLQDANLRLESRIRERTMELEDANANKDRFFSIVAHDLKSPFNSLLGFAEILNNDYHELGDFKRMEILGFLKESAEQVYDLLENLLEWSSAQTGRIVLSPARLDMEKMLAGVIKLSGPQAEKKDITLSMMAQPEVVALADEDTIKTVLRNLISNALKFTPHNGRVELLAFKNKDAQGQAVIRIEVRDTGIGIHADELETLFELTKNKPSAGTDNEPGTGLGLPLSKEFVSINGGSIRVESTRGKGSTFIIELPAAG